MSTHNKEAAELAENCALHVRAAGYAEPIDANALERIAKERPDECFLKGSGVLKLLGAIRYLEAQVRALAASEAPSTEQAPASAREKALNALLWFYRRAKPTYGRLPFAEEAIAALRSEQAPAREVQSLTTGQILALERRSNMTDDEAIRFARSVESLLMRKARALSTPPAVPPELRKQIIDALEIGLDCAQDVAAETHERYKGYKPARHAAVDRDVQTVQDAIAALSAAPAPQVKETPIPLHKAAGELRDAAPQGEQPVQMDTWGEAIEAAAKAAESLMFDSWCTRDRAVHNDACEAVAELIRTLPLPTTGLRSGEQS